MSLTWGPTAVQAAIYGILSNDATLASLLGAGRRIFDFVPDNQVFPYVVLQIKPWKDRGNQTWNGLDSRLVIETWYQPATGDRGDLGVQTIQNRIDQLLHTIDIQIDGWSVVVFRREMVNVITEPDNVTKHGIQRFKLFIGENT